LLFHNPVVPTAEAYEEMPNSEILVTTFRKDKP
jgi:hypothetical protein